MDGLPGFKWTEEKVSGLKPIIERILTKKYGRTVEFTDLTIGRVSVQYSKEENNESICNRS